MVPSIAATTTERILNPPAIVRPYNRDSKLTLPNGADKYRWDFARDAPANPAIFPVNYKFDPIIESQSQSDYYKNPDSQFWNEMKDESVILTNNNQEPSARGPYIGSKDELSAEYLGQAFSGGIMAGPKHMGADPSAPQEDLEN